MDLVDVVAAVVRREGRYLLCLRPQHKRHGGLWEFPGGKVEKHESFEQAVMRELDEELGLSAVSVGNVLYMSQDPGSIFQIHFLEVEVDGEPVAREHDQIKWCTSLHMVELPLAPTDRRFASTLE